MGVTGKPARETARTRLVGTSASEIAGSCLVGTLASDDSTNRWESAEGRLCLCSISNEEPGISPGSLWLVSGAAGKSLSLFCARASALPFVSRGCSDPPVSVWVTNETLWGRRTRGERGRRVSGTAWAWSDPGSGRENSNDDCEVSVM